LRRPPPSHTPFPYTTLFRSPSSSRPDGMGVDPQTMTEKLRRLGLRPGDSVMAIDGYRVHNVAQWLAVRSFSDARSLSAIVWRGGDRKSTRLNSSHVAISYAV